MRSFCPSYWSLYPTGTIHREPFDDLGARTPVARARLQDSVVLFRGQRYDGAIYLCGYAVELALKARICRTLRWDGNSVKPDDVWVRALLRLGYATGTHLVNTRIGEVEIREAYPLVVQP